MSQKRNPKKIVTEHSQTFYMKLVETRCADNTVLTLIKRSLHRALTAIC